jgi:deoxyribonuclease V
MTLLHRDIHSWNLSPSQAVKVQKHLSSLLVSGHLSRVERLAAVDAAFDKEHVYTACVLFSYPALQIIEKTTASVRLSFPYIPGLLTFREGPAIIAALEKLQTEPDVILLDGQGIAHPRGLGLAAHIGLLFDLPTVGCAKSLLFGKVVGRLSNRKGATAPIEARGRIIGAAVRTRANVKPVFISPGHKTNLEDSVKLILRCTGKFRLPEPIRAADALSKSFKRSRQS